MSAGIEEVERDLRLDDAVDEKSVGRDMALALADVGADERVVAATRRKRLAHREKPDDAVDPGQVEAAPLRKAIRAVKLLRADDEILHSA